MNFALTRARHSLWICGNFNSIRVSRLTFIILLEHLKLKCIFLKETFFWTNLMNNASKRDRYHKINEHNFEMVDQILRNTGVTDGDRNLKRKH